MTIRRKLELVMLMSVALGLTLTMIFAVVERGERTQGGLERDLNRLSDRAFQLSLLGQDVVLHPGEPRPAVQWHKANEQLAKMLEQIHIDGDAERAVMQRLSIERERLEEIIQELQTLATRSASVPEALLHERHERANSQMNFVVQTMISEALFLQEYVRNAAQERRRRINLFALTLGAIITAGITLVARGTGRSIVGPLQKLRSGTEIIGGGNLDHRVGTSANDELGELSRDFDSMLVRLQHVTASREKLAQEVGRRIRTEEALRKNTERLKMAQSIARLGHWEWDVKTGEMNWSDETFRILGYDRASLTPNRGAFLQVVHPEDRGRVDQHIEQTRGGHGFDIEFRIVMLDGGERVVHGRGEPITVGDEREQKVIGTLQDISARGRMEVLGVIQDITERKALEHRLEQEAHTDGLTGASNRRYFLELAAREVARARRYGGDVGVLMLDLDHFKRVNDRYGHAVGDMVLKKVVEVCRIDLREEDVIGRLGGEEFGVLLPETDAQRAIEVAERLRQAVAAAEVPAAPGNPPIMLTVSIGVTALVSSDGDIDAMLRRADGALYCAKKAGRNRVEVA